jgi:hypothetical protein
MKSALRDCTVCWVGLLLSAVGCSSSSGNNDLPLAGAQQSTDAGRGTEASAGSDGSAGIDGSASSRGSEGGTASGSSDGGAGSSGSDGGAGSSGSDGGTASGSSDGAASSDAAGADGTVYMPGLPPAVCGPGAILGTGTVVLISTVSDGIDGGGAGGDATVLGLDGSVADDGGVGLENTLDSVTPDELSIAWTVGHGTTAILEYADRDSSAVAFGAPQVLAAGPYAIDRAALSPDGLRLVLVSSGGQGFTELIRSARGDAFGPAPTDAGEDSYSNFEMASSDAGSQAAVYGDPVISADDETFYYSVTPSGGTPTVFRSERLLTTDAWPTGAALHGSAGSLAGKPTGISSDGQTLFLSPMSGALDALWVDDSTGVFGSVVDLGALTSAAPNQACDRLYYSAQGTGSVDLFVASFVASD